MNYGEIDELKAKLSLIYWRDANQHNIQSVGQFIDGRYIEYKSHNLLLTQIKLLDENNLVQQCNLCNIKKTKSIDKADLSINGINYSIKSNRKAMPALVNHTHRAGIEKVCTRIGLSIKEIDDAIDNYWTLRLNGNISEDVKMNTLDNPFVAAKQDFTKLLEYFLFIGTAQQDSSYQADGLIAFTDPCEYKTWNTYTKIGLAQMYIEQVTISIRSKAMPKSYNHNSPKDSIHLSIQKWTRFIDGSYKGALHIRG